MNSITDLLQKPFLQDKMTEYSDYYTLYIPFDGCKHRDSPLSQASAQQKLAQAIGLGFILKTI